MDKNIDNNFNDINISLQYQNDNLKNEILQKNQLINLLENEITNLKEQINMLEKAHEIEKLAEVKKVEKTENNESSYMNYLYSFIYKK